MIEIVYTTLELIPSYHRVLDSVAREKIYLEMLQAPNLDRVLKSQTGLIAKNGPVFYAVTNGQVVGWCDIFPFDQRPTTAHRGGLGMGILKDYRGQSVGSRHLTSALDKAKQFGLKKVELNVYTTNNSAAKLYKKFGFVKEGLIKNFRIVDGQYFDCIAMGKFL